MKKKRILIAVIAVMVIAVIAMIGVRMLGGGSHTGIDNNPEAEVIGDSKILVAYFSWSGNGQQMARWISEETGGELFRIVPEESYGEDYEACADRAKNELDNGIRPELSSHIDADIMAQYDVIYLGYPIWWGIAAWPVDGFIAANDFTGKTVIPFCTSSSSGLGESGELLEEAAGTGKWLEGIRFRSGVSEETVTEWVDSLGLK